MSAVFLIILNKLKRYSVVSTPTPPPPSPYTFIIDNDGKRLIDNDGKQLIDNTIV